MPMLVVGWFECRPPILLGHAGQATAWQVLAGSGMTAFECATAANRRSFLQLSTAGSDPSRPFSAARRIALADPMPTFKLS